MRVLKSNIYGSVSLDGQWIYKTECDEWAANECNWLNKMSKFGYAPTCEQVAADTLKIPYLGCQTESWATATKDFITHKQPVLDALQSVGVRHGDLSVYSIIVFQDRPMLIDFSQSRATDDPQRDKRLEGDAYWLNRSMWEILGRSGLWIEDNHLSKHTEGSSGRSCQKGQSVIAVEAGVSDWALQMAQAGYTVHICESRESHRITAYGMFRGFPNVTIWPYSLGGTDRNEPGRIVVSLNHFMVFNRIGEVDHLKLNENQAEILQQIKELGLHVKNIEGI